MKNIQLTKLRLTVEVFSKICFSKINEITINVDSIGYMEMLRADRYRIIKVEESLTGGGLRCLAANPFCCL